MGKNLNQKAWLEFERLDRQKQEESFEADLPLTEAQKASQFDDFYWDRLDSEVRFFGGRQ